jgi:hypothetical protein
MARDLMRRSCLAILMLTTAQAGWALGSGAPFAPPRSASAPEAAAPTDGAGVLSVNGLSGVRLGAAPMALIDGQWWVLGSAPRGARLQAVDSSGVTLRHPDGKLERLMLHGESPWRAHPRPESRLKGPLR